MKSTVVCFQEAKNALNITFTYDPRQQCFPPWETLSYGDAYGFLYHSEPFLSEFVYDTH